MQLQQFIQKRTFLFFFFRLYISLYPSDLAATMNNRTLWGDSFFPLCLLFVFFWFFGRVESFAFKCHTKCTPQRMIKTTNVRRQPLTSRFPIRFTQHGRHCVTKPHISKNKKKLQRKLATNYRDKHITFLCMLYTLWHVLFPQVFEANSVMKFKLLIQRECRLNTKTPFDKLINGII